MTLIDSTVAALTTRPGLSMAQNRLRLEYLTHLARHPNALWREGHPVHITASCFVLDLRGEHILLTLHRKANVWMQFGGHCEEGDHTPSEAARREAAEESGITDLRWIQQDPPWPVELHRHRLSAAFGQCQEHLDLAYLAVTDLTSVPVVSAESVDVRWWPVTRLPVDAATDLTHRIPRLVEAFDAARSVHARTDSSSVETPAATANPSR